MNDRELVCIVCGKKVKINKYMVGDQYTCFKCRPPKEKKDENK